MNAVVESVRGLWVPLIGTNLMVPNVTIAEIINYQPLDRIHNGPDWLLGALRWRDQVLPVVSMECLLGFKQPQHERGARISVLNSVKGGSSLSFYAMVTAGIPRLIKTDAGTLGKSLLTGKNLPDTVADRVRIGDEEGLIPDLETIQGIVEAGWGGR